MSEEKITHSLAEGQVEIENNEEQEQNEHIKQGTQETKEQIVQENEEQIPDHFYDSDIASVNQNDFMSDHQPPKDIVYERKLLHKEKFLHIFKTIVRVGKGIDKPAPYDQIKLRFKQEFNIPTKKSEEKPEYLASKYGFLEDAEFQTYNLGLKNQQIERLVVSMKQGESAMFELEELEVSKKSNIKILKDKRVFQIEVQKWTTVIDLDSDLKFLKYIRKRGSGPHRVSKFDEVTFKAEILINDMVVDKIEKKDLRIEEEQIAEMPQIVWKILSSMKKQQLSEVKIRDCHIKEVFENSQQTHEYQKMIQSYEKNIEKDSQQEEIKQKKGPVNSVRVWKVVTEVKDIKKIDDFYMDGSILKKTLIKGVSTAKPESSSLMYFALKFLDSHKNVLHEDSCFNSDWWEDYGKLDLLGCRKVHLDEYKISKFLKASMKRMKPAQIAEIECRDMDLFKYGTDFQECKKLWPKDQQFPPKRVFLIVRVYNFTEGLNCFNMTVEEKIAESKRRKPIAVGLLNDGNLKKAHKRFQNIVAFYSSGQINQSAYDQKVSALMNSMLCLMKEGKYSEMIPLCDIVLEQPKHGFDQDKMKINGPQGFKVEGKVENEENADGRLNADLVQNPKIIDKCLYRKALALLKTGESKASLKCIEGIKQKGEEVKKLEIEAEKHLQMYEEKSKKIFKSMFS